MPRLLHLRQMSAWRASADGCRRPTGAFFTVDRRFSGLQILHAPSMASARHIVDSAMKSIPLSFQLWPCRPASISKCGIKNRGRHADALILLYRAPHRVAMSINVNSRLPGIHRTAVLSSPAGMPSPYRVALIHVARYRSQ